MKPKLLKVALKPEQSFSVRHDAVPFFFKELHFHPELELVHIQKGSGTQFIGNHIQHFKAGDMILVGANIPHLWKSDKQYFQGNPSLNAAATVVHFLPDSLGTDFFSLPENNTIKKMLTKSNLGLSVRKKTKEKVADLLNDLLASNGSKRIILLLEILHTLSSSKDVSSINKKEIVFAQTEKETERMNRILQYLLSNFQEKIELKEIATIAHLSPNAFCRYFRLRTNKSFSFFLMEMRINHACKQLAETELPVSEICYESGFNNFSNFNRYFKQLTNFTPLQYKNIFL